MSSEGKEELAFPCFEKLSFKNCRKLTHLLETPKVKDIELDEGRSLLSSEGCLDEGTFQFHFLRCLLKCGLHAVQLHSHFEQLAFKIRA
jgi:hypothetical protein